jgi:exonuclease III
MLSETIKDRIKSASILPQVFHSDHCPVSVEIEIGN